MQTSDFRERKNKRLAAILILLIVVTIIVGIYTRSPEVTNVDRSLFQIANTESVDKVVIEKSGQQIVLEFDGTKWRVNEKYEADGNMVKVLMATLRQTEVKRQLAASSSDSVTQRMSSSGVKVSVYSEESLIRSFLSSGNSRKTQTFFAEPDKSNVYVVNIPGYRVYVGGIFELSESGWRNKTVFDFNWRNFQRLEARFPETPANNFVVSPQKGIFGVEGLKTDTTKLSNFMDAVLSLAVEEFSDSNTLFDSLRNTPPFMEILINDVARQEYRLKIFKQSPSGAVPGLLNDSEAVTINAQRVRPIIRPKSYFELR